MNFQDKLDKIWTRISDDDFLANRGVANEVRYYVFDYEPCDELIMRQKIESLKKQNNPESRNTGTRSSVFDRSWKGIPIHKITQCVEQFTSDTRSGSGSNVLSGKLEWTDLVTIWNN